MKRTALSKRGRRKERRDKDTEVQAKRTLMIEMFAEIWNERPYRCFETDEPLGSGEPLTIYFHHVLPKEKFPQYTLCKWNIVLLSWRAHDQARIDMDKIPKVKQLYLELLEKHHNFELNK